VRDDGPVVGDITAAVYVIPTDAPEADGTLAWDTTIMVLACARTGTARGIGWTYAAAAAAGVITGVLAGVVTGRSAMDVAGAAEAMARAVRNIGRPGIAATAISAVDTALWDLKARLLGVPLSRLLGRARDGVPIYGSGGFTSYDEHQTREQLSGWVDKDRIPRVKIKIGESWGSCEQRDLDRVALAREVIGPNAELYVDANGGYTAGQAVRVGQRPWRQRTTCRSPGTVRPTSMRGWALRCRTCGTSSISMTTSGSRGCSSTAPWARRAGS
jgi:L-alanine-DL-glutamate epimerase-like enolase superfamily enzyme